jgi:peptidoglycan/xylan/chitin deacetylase (PgdA/CDA1 family)
MTLLHSPRFFNWVRRHLLCRVEGVSDRFALTFDDGPSPRTTPRVLDLLAEHDARATFFVLGRHVRRHPEIVRRAASEGHEIGLHGEGHLPLPLLPRRVVERHLASASHLVAEITGRAPRVYRPPFGILTPALARILRELGYLPVLGDVYPEDPRRPGVERIVRRVLPRLTGGSILILHDASALGDFDRGQTIAAVDAILGEATRRGLAATTVGELAARAGVTLPARIGDDATR